MMWSNTRTYTPENSSKSKKKGSTRKCFKNHQKVKKDVHSLKKKGNHQKEARKDFLSHDQTFLENTSDWM